MANLRLTADSSQLVSEVKKAKDALKTARSEYKAASAEAELYGTKEGQLVNKIKAANQMQATRTAALQTYQKAITQLKSEIDKWEKEEQELIQKLKEAQQANDTAKVKEYENALKNLRTQIKNNTTELNSTNKSYNDLRTEIAQTAKQTNDLQAELDDLSNTFEEVETISEDAGDNMDSMGDGAEGAATAVFSLQDALSTASGVLRDFGDMIDGLTNKFEKFVANGIQKTVEALVSLGEYSLNTGLGFEQATSELMATMGLDKTSAEYEPLKQTAEFYGRTTKYTATEAANALNILAQAGLNAEQQMAAIPTVLNLASAGAMDLKTAATYATAAVKGYGDAMVNAEKYVDLIAKGATLANTDANLLGAAMAASAANANAYSQSADTLTLSLLRLADQNVKGTDASTALNRMITDLYAPTAAAAAVLDELGISAYDDAHNARDLTEVVEELNNVLKTYDEESQNAMKAQLFTTNGLNAFNKMVVTSKDKVDEWASTLENANGAAADMAKTMIDNLQGDIFAFTSATEGFGIKIYEGIVPGIRQAVQDVTAFITQLTDNFEKNGLGEAIGKISKAFSNFATQIPALLQKHGPTIIRIFNSIIDIVVILLDSLPALIDSALPNLMSIIENLSQKLPAFLEKVMPKIIDGVGWLASNFPILIVSLYGLQGLSGAGTGLLQGLSGAGAGLLDFGGIIANVGMAAKMTGTSLGAIAKMAWTSLGAIAKVAAPVVAGVLAIVAVFAALATTIGTAYATSENFRVYVSVLFDDIETHLSGFVESVKKLLGSFGVEVESAGDGVNILLNTIETAAIIIMFILEQLLTSWIDLFTFLINTFNDLVSIITNFCNIFVSMLSGNYEEALTYTKNFANSIDTMFVNMWNAARDDCKDFGTDFGDFMVALQNVAGDNPIKISIESDLDEESFKRDLRLVASWGLPGWDENKFGPLFRDDKYLYQPNLVKSDTIQAGIDIANASINNWQNGNKSFNINNITNSPVYNWNTSDEGDENVFIKMTRETEAYGKYTSG